jgi:hypothetical protein
MPIYLLYIEDGRYSAPQMDSIDAADDAHAIEAARARVNSSVHYLSAEVWEDNRFVAHIQRTA